jgi:ubiquitin-protein ligase
MAQNAIKRLMVERKNGLGEHVTEIITLDNKTKIRSVYFHAQIDDNNLFKMTGILTGPVFSAYEGHQYKFAINLTSEYPFKPPQIVFTDPIYHPNVQYSGGSICLSTLKSGTSRENWTPSNTIHSALMSIHQLLSYPNPDDPFNSEAAEAFKKGDNYFRERVKEKYKGVVIDVRSDIVD